MKKQDRIRVVVSIMLIALGFIGYYDGKQYGEELYAIPIFILALYPFSKMGYEDRFKI